MTWLRLWLGASPSGNIFTTLGLRVSGLLKFWGVEVKNEFYFCLFSYGGSLAKRSSINSVLKSPNVYFVFHVLTLHLQETTLPPLSTQPGWAEITSYMPNPHTATLFSLWSNPLQINSPWQPVFHRVKPKSLKKKTAVIIGGQKYS
jgi:hypothetical protein